MRMQSESRRIPAASRIARTHWVPMRMAFVKETRAFPAAPIQRVKGREHEANGRTSMAVNCARQIKSAGAQDCSCRERSVVINCGPTMPNHGSAITAPTAKKACLLPKPAWQLGLNRPYECKQLFLSLLSSGAKRSARVSLKYLCPI